MWKDLEFTILLNLLKKICKLKDIIHHKYILVLWINVE